MVTTPTENLPEEEKDEESESVGIQNKEKAVSLDSVSESWVTHHAKQVLEAEYL
jgi:hypothetical protein